jgi:hypothetical protein
MGLLLAPAVSFALACESETARHAPPPADARDAASDNLHPEDGADPADRDLPDGSAGNDGGALEGGDGSPSDDATDGDAPANDGFAPREGLDPGGRARRIGNTFWTGAQTLLEARAGSSWLLWRSYADPKFTGEVVHLDHFDAAGVFVKSSALEALNPDGVVLHADGALSAWRKRCGPLMADICFHRDAAGMPIAETVWPVTRRSVLRSSLDWDGNVVGSAERAFDERYLLGAISKDQGLYVVSQHGSQILYRLDGGYAPVWSVELWPAVVPPALPPDAPIEELLRAADLVLQTATDPVLIEGGAVVAATVTRGTLAALKTSRNLDFPLPSDPRCPDVLIAKVPDDGSAPQLHSIPTPECESLPKLTVVGNRAVVSSVLPIAKPPEPNDAYQYDIGLGIVDLSTGRTISRVIAFEEDNWVNAIAPCGADRVCLAGVTGSKSVDTGSTVSFGKGFVLPVSLTGEPGKLWLSSSPRHSEIQKLVAGAGGAVLFFGTVNGPITHTADADPWLGFNEGLFGLVEGI